MFNKFFFSVYEIILKKCGIVGQATDDTLIWRMRFACWVVKTTDTHSKYLILITFPRQKMFRRRASVLLSYVHCLITFIIEDHGHSS